MNRSILRVRVDIYVVACESIIGRVVFFLNFSSMSPLVGLDWAGFIMLHPRYLDTGKGQHTLSHTQTHTLLKLKI